MVARATGVALCLMVVLGAPGVAQATVADASNPHVSADGLDPPPNPNDPRYVSLARGKSRTFGKWKLAAFTDRGNICARVWSRGLSETVMCANAATLSDARRSVPLLTQSGGGVVMGIATPDVTMVKIRIGPTGRSIETHTVKGDARFDATFFFGVRPSSARCATLRLTAFDAHHRVVASQPIPTPSGDEICASKRPATGRVQRLCADEPDVILCVDVTGNSLTLR